MQEEVENKSVAISIKATKLTANVLKAALLKALAEMEKKQKNPKVYKGKQSVKHLVRQGVGVSNIEITDGNIKSFEKVARKYGIDFALKKDVSTQPPRYLVFFKANDEHYLRRWFYVWIDCFEFHHTLCYGFCRIYLKEAPGKRYDIR